MENPATNPGPDCAMARRNREHRRTCQSNKDASALFPGRLCPQAGDRDRAGADFPGGWKGALTGVVCVRVSASPIAGKVGPFKCLRDASKALLSASFCKAAKRVVHHHDG